MWLAKVLTYKILIAIKYLFTYLLITYLKVLTYKILTAIKYLLTPVYFTQANNDHLAEFQFHNLFKKSNVLL